MTTLEMSRLYYYIGRSSLKKLLDGGRDSVRTLLIQKCTDDAFLFAIFLMKQLLFDIFRLKPDKCVEMVHFFFTSHQMYSNKYGILFCTLGTFFKFPWFVQSSFFFVRSQNHT